jgi:hypothetical protein
MGFSSPVAVPMGSLTRRASASTGTAVAVLVGGQAVVVDHDLRAGRDREVVDQRAQRRVAHVLHVVEDVGQAVADRGARDLLERGDVIGVALAREGASCALMTWRPISHACTK